MAFIRKHRERYWLVHNFRTGDKVQQVRLYSFDLHADPEHEMAQAQRAVEALYPGQIAPTWVATVQQQLQQATGTTTGQVVGVQQPNAKQQLVLIKFGTELHGPMDRMTINRDHILFWEDLKPDSTVVRSITQYKEGQQPQ